MVIQKVDGHRFELAAGELQKLSDVKGCVRIQAGDGWGTICLF